MTTAERVQAVQSYGFTERQARFLVLVMRHSGLCIKRQYASFAGIAPGGEQSNRFFERLARDGYALSSDCIHNRARLYHVHHRRLYEAIGDPESRYRRRVPARQAAERLMRLDAALLSPDLDWLVTRAEKLAHLEQTMAAGVIAAPSMPRTSVVDALPGTCPVGLEHQGRAVVLYLAGSPATEDFRLFLLGHLTFLAAHRAWTVRVVLPATLRRAVGAYEQAAREELATPLSEPEVNDLMWYFFHRRRNTDWSDRGEYAGSDGLRARFVRCAKAFSGPRFALLYRHWLTLEKAALTSVPELISEPLRAGTASIEAIVLPHTYDHLSPLVTHRRTRRTRYMADAKQGETPSARSQPAPQPAPEPGSRGTHCSGAFFETPDGVS